jgi:antirestriction protein ArdC
MRAAKAPSTPKKSVYEVITERIVEQLKKGVVVWKQPWAKRAPGASMWPTNHATGRAYSGFNAIFLNFAAAGLPAVFLTFNQAKSLGGSVRAGEKGFPVVYYQPARRSATVEETEETKSKKAQRGVLQYFTVFHYSQIDGIDFNLPDAAEVPAMPTNEQAQKLVEAYTTAPRITHLQQKAYYSPVMDFVNMPKPATFTSPDHYYCTLFHELIHSTGHEDRMNREGIAQFDFKGSPRYAKEELIAEMGASFLCGFAGIDPDILGHNAAYIAHWLEVLQNDPKMVISAASQAEKAVRYMLGELQPKEPVGIEQE